MPFETAWTNNLPAGDAIKLITVGQAKVSN